MTLKNRLILFIEYKGLTVQSFEKMVKLSNGAVSKMSDNTRRSTLDKISNNFPELNINWLLTGEGAMLQGDGEPASQPLPEAEKTGESGEGDAMMALISGQLREKDAVICRQMEEIRELERENGRLQERNGQLADQVERLTESNKDLRAQVARLTPSASPLAELTPRL